MEKYLSHYSALKHWNFPLAHQYFNEKLDHSPQQYLVRDVKARSYKKEISTHVCTKNLPKNSFVKLDNEQKIVSPQLMFLQLASTLDIIETIILGYLLCAYPEGIFSKSLIGKSQLIKYVSSTNLSHKKKALRALKYVQEGANSIMEIFVAMLLNLPNALGGLSIPGGVLNYKVELDDLSARAIKKKNLYIDYCFPNQKIGYEYQGVFHNQTIDEDSNRKMALKRMGYEIVTITKTQLYDENKLRLWLTDAAKTNRKKIRIRTDKYMKYFNRIIELLPKPDFD
ncbi:MAG TPA: hypothetical protein GXZ43_06080 [Clostridiaceae bacterium]|mgnify:CR=1 FL=1|nr:hypothetical protein [Clostridiaceae bacterium]